MTRFFYSVNKLDIVWEGVMPAVRWKGRETIWSIKTEIKLSEQCTSGSLKAAVCLYHEVRHSYCLWRCAFMSLYKWDNWDSFREMKRLYITWWENDKASMNPKWSSRVNTTFFRDRSLGPLVCLRGWLMLVWSSLFSEMLVHLSKKSI